LRCLQVGRPLLPGRLLSQLLLSRGLFLCRADGGLADGLHIGCCRRSGLRSSLGSSPAGLYLGTGYSLLFLGPPLFFSHSLFFSPSRGLFIVPRHICHSSCVEMR
jgi:hypothetical protein